MQNAKITKEIQTNRIKEGTSTEFTAGFAGNPQPEVAFFYLLCILCQYFVSWLFHFSGGLVLQRQQAGRVWQGEDHDEHDHLDLAHGRLHHGDGRRLRVQDRQQARQRQDQSQPDHQPSVWLGWISSQQNNPQIQRHVWLSQIQRQSWFPQIQRQPWLSACNVTRNFLIHSLTFQKVLVISFKKRNSFQIINSFFSFQRKVLEKILRHPSPNENPDYIPLPSKKFTCLGNFNFYCKAHFSRMSLKWWNPKKSKQSQTEKNPV